MIHPSRGAIILQNQDDRPFFRAVFFLNVKILIYHPSVILAISTKYCCIILVSSYTSGSCLTHKITSWCHPHQPAMYIYFHLMNVSSNCHPGSHPGIMLSMHVHMCTCMFTCVCRWARIFGMLHPAQEAIILASSYVPCSPRPSSWYHPGLRAAKKQKTAFLENSVRQRPSSY